MLSRTGVLRLDRIEKSFGATRALAGVSLELGAGEVHGLAGANGAGKSTLIKILGGAIGDYGGTISIEGGPVRFEGPRAARRAGIAVVHQEITLVETLSLEDALLLGLDEGPMLGWLHRGRRRTRARAMLALLDLSLDLDAPVASLPLSLRQLASLARALEARPRVLVMDEPTSALGERDTATLLEHVRAQRARGVAVLFCSHRIAELHAVSDRISVLRDGALAASGPPSDLPRERLVAAMLGGLASGRDEERPEARPAPERVEIRSLLRVAGLVVEAPLASRPVVDAVDLDVGAGEVVGIASVRGGGGEALLRAIVGEGARARGVITLEGHPFAPRSPIEAAERGVLMLASDRRETVLAEMPIRHNASLSALDTMTKLGFVDRRAEAGATASSISRAAVRMRAVPFDDGLPARALSGGNQQKLALARCLLAKPRLLLVHDPTRGVDIAAQPELHRLLREAAAGGAAVIVASDDLDELFDLCDRIVALSSGRVTGVFERSGFERAAVVAATMGAASEATQ